MVFIVTYSAANAAVFVDGEKAFNANDYKKAISIWQQLAKQDDVSSQLALAKMYAVGLGVKKNLEESLKFYHKAAEQGSAEAQYQLGEMYSRAQNVARDYVEARKWYQKAANQGYAPAIYKFGVGYFRGEGTSTDYMRAHAWMNVAVIMGYESGIAYRDQLAEVLSKEKLEQSEKISSQLLEELKKKVDADK